MSIILKAEGISRTYKSGSVEVNALKKCDLEVEEGRFYSIVGKSGAGKSTLLRILAGMDRPDTGSVYVDGEDIFKLKDKDLAAFRRRKIGYVYQDYSLFPEFTGLENIYMPQALDKKDMDREEIDDLMEALEIAHCKDKLPTQMSGGEQQRVALARALITKPAVVFADEPTGNLDMASAKTVADMFQKASQHFHQTIIMVTHDQQMAELADGMIRISDGGLSYEQ